MYWRERIGSSGENVKVTMRGKLLFNYSNVAAETVLWLICVMLVALFPSSPYAQQPDKIPHIGFLQRRVPASVDNPDPLGAAFRQGLRDLGYIDGKNIRLEHRYAHGRSDLLPSLVAEFVQLKVDVIVVASIQAIRAAAQATKTIPIVIVSQTDPITDGFVRSLARPGGNITGLMRLTSELSGKRLELLKQAIPRVSRVGILGGSTNLQASVQDYEPAAHAQQITLQLLELREPNPDFEATFQGAANAGVNAIITNRDALTASYLKRIADLAIKYRLPSMNEDSPYVEAGGLMSYATKDADQFRRAAIYVDKILKGAKPADLPIEQPTKFELVINLKTAKQIGLTIPPNVLARADRVIR
jgi:putative tryptophan/tyrosine transport system substrate-binding protein